MNKSKSVLLIVAAIFSGSVLADNKLSGLLEFDHKFNTSGLAEPAVTGYKVGVGYDGFNASFKSLSQSTETNLSYQFNKDGLVQFTPELEYEQKNNAVNVVKGGLTVSGSPFNGLFDNGFRVRADIEIEKTNNERSKQIRLDYYAGKQLDAFYAQAKVIGVKEMNNTLGKNLHKDQWVNLEARVTMTEYDFMPFVELSSEYSQVTKGYETYAKLGASYNF
ncbi:hypothetical protein AB733_03135 [Photobacterium swingsii]|uniref:Porin n=1 Tax=Photobacterium swingsii TaxID=680026 RepID=A0A0J8VF97_9GAMM|nr:hypothetical protein [Photobacterium swingsii]KMV31787.1 hypothetical protein AB733_03135 [Photobacterium swingsii]PSW25403.1 hypothetical protein C9I94_07055 [Photobacterium swingsii]